MESAIFTCLGRFNTDEALPLVTAEGVMLAHLHHEMYKNTLQVG